MTTSNDDERDDILYAVADGVATLTLNRPARLNAWTGAMETLLRDRFEAAVSDPAVRAIVLTGAGRAFCAGADLDAVSGPGLLAAPPRREGDYAQRYSWIAAVPKPTICAVNGAAIGIGLVLALMCDIRFAVPQARIAAAFTRRGLPAEHGSAWLLVRAVGTSNAADILLSGRTLSGDEAGRIGLVRMLPADGFAEAVAEYARDIADNCAPCALAVTKRQLNIAWSQSLAQATRTADLELAACEGGEEMREGVASFLERRPPRFSGIVAAPPVTPDAEVP